MPWPPSSPVVGREAEIARLSTLIGRGPLVVTGAPGIGKTALVLAAVPRDRRTRGAYLSVRGCASVRELLEVTARSLGRGGRTPDAGAECQALRRLLERQGGVVVWDDGQDAAPRPLAEAMAALAGAPVRLVVVGRALAVPPGIASFEVPPLDAEGSRALLAGIERERGRSLHEELVLRAGGNPLSLRVAFSAALGESLAAPLEEPRRHATVRLGGGTASTSAATLMLAREHLRRGDFDAARQSLEAVLLLPGAAASTVQRARILHAETLIRAGDPVSAARELERARPAASPAAARAIELALAELAVLRGELAQARRALLGLEPRTRGRPAFEERRATALALSYLFEERHAQALAWTRRARLASRQRAAGARNPLTAPVEIAALLGLDRIDRAMAAAAREASGEGSDPPAPGPAALVKAGILFRRGELAAALETSAPTYRALDRRADQIFRAIVAHYSARSAIGLGDFAGAETLLRQAAGISAEPGLAVLRPWCDADFAVLLDARGNRAEAQVRIRRALDVSAPSPYARVEAWALGAVRDPPALRSDQACGAFLALRSAERALEVDHLEEAVAKARIAARWYERAGAEYELARALLAEGEGLARLGLEGGPSLAASSALSGQRGYRAVLIGALLVRASLADRAGDQGSYREALRRCLELADPGLHDEALRRACARAGLPATEAQPATCAPFRDRIARLGLDRPCAIMAVASDRCWLLDENEAPAERFALTVDILRGEARSIRGAVALPPQRLQLLESLVRAGPAGTTLEELYCNVWRSGPWHPLRHRNTVYVAITRLRESLAGLLEGSAVGELSDGRYRLDARTVVVCRPPNPPSAQPNFDSNEGAGQTK